MTCSCNKIHCDVCGNPVDGTENMKQLKDYSDEEIEKEVRFRNEEKHKKRLEQRSVWEPENGDDK